VLEPARLPPRTQGGPCSNTPSRGQPSEQADHSEGGTSSGCGGSRKAEPVLPGISVYEDDKGRSAPHTLMSARSEEGLWGGGRHQGWRATSTFYPVRRLMTNFLFSRPSRSRLHTPALRQRTPPPRPRRKGSRRWPPMSRGCVCGRAVSPHDHLPAVVRLGRFEGGTSPKRGRPRVGGYGACGLRPGVDGACLHDDLLGGGRSSGTPPQEGLAGEGYGPNR
jgi:hypothetical protein